MFQLGPRCSIGNQTPKVPTYIRGKRYNVEVFAKRWYLASIAGCGKMMKISQSGGRLQMTLKKTRRFVLNCDNIRRVDDEQVSRIVKATDPELVFSKEEITRLRYGINAALDWIVPRFGKPGMTDVEDIRKAVNNLKKKLHPANVFLLGAIGSAANGNFHPRERVVVIDRDVTNTISSFSKLTDDVLQWLLNMRACTIVDRSRKPELGLLTLTGHLLPDLFQMTFFKKFKTGFSSPGMKFVAAVLREAGVRNRDDEDDPMFEQIKHARRRVTNSS
jgi:hypothetical protein